MFGESGVIMLLKSFGVDQTQITQLVEMAKTAPVVLAQLRNAAQQTVQHFDMRLQAIEKELSEQRKLVTELVDTLKERRTHGNGIGTDNASGSSDRNGSD